jgi:hypothetical protein
VLSCQLSGALDITIGHRCDDVLQIPEILFHLPGSCGEKLVVVAVDIVVNASENEAENGIVRDIGQRHVYLFIDAHKGVPLRNPDLRHLSGLRHQLLQICDIVFRGPPCSQGRHHGLHPLPEFGQVF